MTLEIASMKQGGAITIALRKASSGHLYAITCEGKTILVFLSDRARPKALGYVYHTKMAMIWRNVTENSRRIGNNRIGNNIFDVTTFNAV